MKIGNIIDVMRRMIPTNRIHPMDLQTQVNRHWDHSFPMFCVVFRIFMSDVEPGWKEQSSYQLSAMSVSSNPTISGVCVCVLAFAIPLTSDDLSFTWASDQHVVGKHPSQTAFNPLFDVVFVEEIMDDTCPLCGPVFLYTGRMCTSLYRHLWHTQRERERTKHAFHLIWQYMQAQFNQWARTHNGVKMEVSGVVCRKYIACHPNHGTQTTPPELATACESGYIIPVLEYMLYAIRIGRAQGAIDSPMRPCLHSRGVVSNSQRYSAGTSPRQ